MYQLGFQAVENTLKSAWKLKTFNPILNGHFWAGWSRAGGGGWDGIHHTL